MAPQYSGHVWTSGSSLSRRDAVTKPTDASGLILEAWSQGFMVGAIVIMICITLANLKRGVILHKLILLELFLGVLHGTFIFNDAPIYGWYLSVTAIFLNMSWSLHNYIAWMKNRPFMGRKVSIFFLGTLILVQPYWVLEIYANFTYFNNINKIFVHTRPFEALCRDPWWIFTTLSLFYNIRARYDFKYFELMYISPRFGIMLIAMVFSIIFTVVDILSVTDAFQQILPDGLNPFWKLSFVFKLLTDTIILDDFKTALDKLCAFNLSRIEENRLNDNWAARKETAIERTIMRRPTTASLGSQRKRLAVGTPSAASPGVSWTDEGVNTTIESIQLSDMGRAPVGHRRDVSV